MSVTLFPGIAQSASLHDRIEAYLQPYASSENFSGSILVVQSGKTLFQGSYGLSDVRRKTPNRADTKFHVASLSMQFTAAAAMRLVEQGKLSLDTKVSDVVAGVPNGEKITVRHLLQENSGLPDANDLPGYEDLMKAHQTPATLVQFIRGHPPLREPGGKTEDEEHSAYNLLALIMEKKTGLSFKELVRREVFAPLGMKNSGIDDDSPIASPMALGYVEKGAVDRQLAPTIHWSSLPGNGSAYSTVVDEHRWLAAFFGDSFLSKTDRLAMLGWEDGYGWYESEPGRFGESIYYMTGEAPGIASVIVYMPKLHTEIIILSNFRIPLPTPVALDVAAMMAGGEFHPLELQSAPLTSDEVSHVVGRYDFGPDFYRKNATLELANGPDGLLLKWPGGPDGPYVASPVLVTDNHHFIDRHYWTRFSVESDASGRAIGLTFGRFKGRRSEGTKP